MDTTNRREFLRNSSLAVGALTVPDWIAQAFAHQDPEGKDKKEPTREEQLRVAWRRAQARGKPLLVFVVPAVEGQRYARGQNFGALLNHGGPGVLLDLAICEPSCATVEEVTKVVKAGAIKGEPLMLLINSEGGKHAVTHIDPDLTVPADEGADEGAEEGDVPLPRGFAKIDKNAELRKDRLVRALRDAVVPDRASLVERADDVRRTLAPDEVAVLNQYFAGGAAPDDGLLVRAAAVIRMAAEAPRKPGDRARMDKAIVAATQKLTIEKRIPGAKWAHSMGCGTRVEGVQRRVMIACGMGHVPKVSQRFLYFFAQ